MPISIDEFESDDLPSGPSVPEQVVSFLAANDDKAFTRTELATSIDVDADTVSTALSRLESRDLVRHKDEFWAITNDVDRLRNAYELHTVSERLNEEDGGIDHEAWDETTPDESHLSERPQQHGEDEQRGDAT